MFFGNQISHKIGILKRGILYMIFWYLIFSVENCSIVGYAWASTRKCFENSYAVFLFKLPCSLCVLKPLKKMFIVGSACDNVANLKSRLLDQMDSFMIVFLKCFRNIRVAVFKTTASSDLWIKHAHSIQNIFLHCR